MTPEQIKRVAEIVTGEEATLSYVMGSLPMAIELIFTRKHGYWFPSFTGPVLQRSQALDVVEWLYDRDMWGDLDVGKAVKNRDIETLMQMVLEVGGE